MTPADKHDPFLEGMQVAQAERERAANALHEELLDTMNGISPVMPQCTVIPAVRVCHRCDAPCTADDKTCPVCGAAEDDEREPSSEP